MTSGYGINAGRERGRLNRGATNIVNNNHYVQYGCGWSAPKGWRNFDASPTLRFERLPLVGRLYTKNSSRFPESVEYGDIVHGLPVPDNSCRAVYCSHILEHLSLNDVRTSLKNTHRILSKGGVFRLVLPDLESCIKQYANDTTPAAAITFMKQTSLGKEVRNRGIIGFFHEWAGNSQHLWMWDYKSIEIELRSAGFINIRRAQFGDASDDMFKEVEDKGRWDDCLGVECKK